MSALPTKKRKRQGGQAPALPKIPVNTNVDTPPTEPLQHACRLDREADALIQQGFVLQAERLAWRAAAMREVVA
jgi:hypothetical protein